MKKKYLYQGELMEETDVMDAAKQSNMDIDSYIKKAGIQVVEDDYSLAGEKYTAQEVLDAANESKLGFDDYIQKAGFEKKSQNGNGSNGSGQPAATTSALPEEQVGQQPEQEDEYSGKRPSSYPLKDTKTGFKTQINLQTPPEQLAPEDELPKKTSLQILKDDYLSDKVNIDKSLTSTVGDDPAFGKYVPDDSLFNAMVDPKNPDITLLKKYSEKKAKDLERERSERKAALDKKYPDQPIKGMGQSGEWRPQDYYVEMDALDKEIADRKALIDAPVYDMAVTKKFNDDLKKVAKPKFDMKDWGRYIRNAVADSTLGREERYEVKGIPLSPAEKYYNDKVGFQAMASALKDLGDKGVDIWNNPAAMQLFHTVKEGKRKLLTDHKDFAKDQAARLISNEIFRDKNWFQVMTGAYTVNDRDIQKAAKTLGLPDDIAKLVHEGDIQTSNMFGEFTNELAARPGANIGTFIGRPFRREILGQDPDAIDYHYEQLNKKYTTFFANSPDAQALFGKDTEVAGDPTDESSFLEDVRNAKKGKFNWSVSAIASTIGNGAGQMIQYGLGGNAAGAGLRGINKLLKLKSSVEASKDVGLVTYGFLNAYEGGYQRARQLVGDEPAKEGTRNIIGAASALIEAFSELIFKDYKVTDKLFGVKNPGSRQLLELLAKSKAEDGAKTLASAVGRKTLTKAIMEGVVKTGKQTLEEIGEEEASLIGDVVINALSNKKSLDDRNIWSEAIETAVQTGISAAVPIGLGEMRNGDRTSGIRKSMIYEMGADPQTYLSHINKEASDGKISQDLANKKSSVVNTMADIVKSVPEISAINGQRLSEKNKQDYSYNLLHATMLEKKVKLIEKIDPTQAKIAKNQISELSKERDLILQTADGIERNMNGKPIYERDQTPLDKAKELLDGTVAGAAFQGMNDDESIKFVAKQAQNVQSDGTVSKLQESKNAYDAAVRAFGQPLVDAAVLAFPLESLIAVPEEAVITMADIIPIRNDDFVNKYFKEGTPERQQFEDLDEEGQGKMIAEKREELKFAPKPAAEKVEAPPVEEIKEPGRSQAEIDYLLSDELLDEKGAPVINEKTNIAEKKIPFKQKYTLKVDYKDIATGEILKDVKVYNAKKQLADDYEAVNDFINCK